MSAIEAYVMDLIMVFVVLKAIVAIGRFSGGVRGFLLAHWLSAPKAFHLVEQDQLATRSALPAFA